MKKTAKLTRARPMPPAGLGEAETEWKCFAPAPEVEAWIRDQILSEDGAIHNPDHKHLVGADLRVLWAADAFVTKGRMVVGTAEQVAFRCSAWQRERQEQQMREWFGSVPTYLITLAASYANQCSDAEWCALVEHEMYHVAHALDEFGQPAFTKDGEPKISIRGHDVEEFVGVVRRYGVGNPDGALAKLARAARNEPEVSRVSVAGACGTCHLRLA